MRIETLSVFPDVFEPYMSSSIMGRAQEKGLLDFCAYDLRDWTHDRHRTVDDAPFGGGQGMLMKCEPIFEAVEDIRLRYPEKPHIIFVTPAGQSFNQATAQRLSQKERLLFVCGRYEGTDERVFSLADELISLGDYVLTGGELAALVIADATLRLIPGVLGDQNSARDESFSDGLLEYAQYTRPADYHGMKVPEVLLSGNHAAVAAWRRLSQLERTARFRPDLLEKAKLSDQERSWVAEILSQLAPAEEESNDERARL